MNITKNINNNLFDKQDIKKMILMVIYIFYYAKGIGRNL